MFIMSSLRFINCIMTTGTLSDDKFTVRSGRQAYIYYREDHGVNSEVLLFTKEEFYLQILKLGYIMKQMMYRGLLGICYILSASNFVMHKTSSPLRFSRVGLHSSSIRTFTTLVSVQTSIFTTESMI